MLFIPSFEISVCFIWIGITFRQSSVSLVLLFAISDVRRVAVFDGDLIVLVASIAIPFLAVMIGLVVVFLTTAITSLVFVSPCVIFLAFVG